MSRYDYNLVVIGAGSAGLVASYIAATVNAKVALIERHKMGGDCLNTGCVPSKALIRSAEVMSLIRQGESFGLKNARAEVDFPAVMRRVQDIIKQIEPHDSMERYESLGVECIAGEAEICDPHRVKVGDKTLSTRAIVLATGAEPLVPPIEGLEDIDYLTSDNLWDLNELPEKLVVLGGGPIGCEMAQAFSRLGSHVTVVEKSDRLMKIEDEDASEILHKAFEKEGIAIRTGLEAVRVEPGKLIAKQDDQEVALPFDKILLALGRSSRKMKEWEKLGIQLNEKGQPLTNEYLQTSIPNIYACGDLIGPYQFTHVAAHEAWFASVNALLGGLWRFRVDYETIPWCTFTHPAIARVGLNEQEAKQKAVSYEASIYRLDDLDRAIADGKTAGFVKVLTKPGKDEILGVTIAGEDAGNLIAEFILAKKHGLGLNGIFSAIHIYPTLSEANKYTAGQWKKAHKPGWALELAKIFFNWRR